MPAQGDGRHATAGAVVLALLFIALYAFQLYLHATRTSATVDEPVHLLAGYRHLSCGDYAFNPEHPPLLKQLAAAPLLGREIVVPAGLACDAGFTPKQASFRMGNQFLVDNGLERVLLPARFAATGVSLLMALLLLGGTWRMLGRSAALVATGLLAVEPVMVAHGSLVTTDMAITLASFGAVCALYAAPGWRPAVRVGVVGLAFGTMLLAKHSALVVFPFIGLLVVLDARLRGGGGRGWATLARRDVLFAAAASVLALGLLWAGYEFRGSATPGRPHTVDLGAFLGQVGRPGIGSSSAAAVLFWLESTRLFPESYLMGLADIIGTGERPSRIFDQTYPRGQWFYFPIALALKSGLPILLLAPVGAWSLWQAGPGKRRALLFLTVVPAGYLLVSLTSGINIGVRHVLPVYPFLIVLAAAGALHAWRAGGGRRWALALLLAIHLASVWRAAPDYLPYANPAWQWRTPYSVLPDANFEWGQSLKRVADDARERGVADRCWYAGVGAPLLHQATQPCRLLPDGYRWVVVDPPVETVPSRMEGTIYLSVRMLPPRGGGEYLPLLEAGAARLLAGTVLVFEGAFELPLVAALSHARRADALLEAGRVEEALAEASRALALGAGDPRVRVSHANALLRSGDVAGAVEHARIAQAQVLADPARYEFVRTRLSALLARLPPVD